MAALILIFSYLFLFSFVPLITGGDPYYQFLQLVLQNPQSVDRTAITKYFTVHGVWPTNSTKIKGSTYSIYIPIQDCPMNPPFRFSMFPAPDAEKLVNEFWINYKPNRSNKDFFEYQYTKHGSCTILQIIAPLFYLNVAYDMWDKSPLHTWFSDKSIKANIPSLTSDFESAIIAGSGKRPRLKCDKSELQEVILCYDVKGKTRIDCPLYKPSCPGPPSLIKYVR